MQLMLPIPEKWNNVGGTLISTGLPDPARDRDQRKLLYFKAKSVPGGFSSFVYIKREGNDLNITLPNPGGKTSEKVWGFAAGKLTFGVWHTLVFEMHMNTQPYNGTPGDGRFIAWLDGEQVIDIQNCVLMEGVSGMYPIDTFQFGDQWQSSPIDTSIPHFERRYFRSVRVMKQ
jgi:hypothetical protein